MSNYSFSGEKAHHGRVANVGDPAPMATGPNPPLAKRPSDGNNLSINDYKKLNRQQQPQTQEIKVVQPVVPQQQQHQSMVSSSQQQQQCAPTNPRHAPIRR